MTQRNGLDGEAEQTERLISLLVRVNDALLRYDASLRSLSDQLRLGLEQAREERQEHRDMLGEVRHHILEVREDTDPRGHRLLDSAEVLAQKNDSGPVAIRDGKVKLALPASWVGVVLKLGVSAGAGGLALRVIQWLTTGH